MRRKNLTNSEVITPSPEAPVAEETRPARRRPAAKKAEPVAVESAPVEVAAAQPKRSRTKKVVEAEVLAPVEPVAVEAPAEAPAAKPRSRAKKVVAESAPVPVVEAVAEVVTPEAIVPAKKARVSKPKAAPAPEPVVVLTGIEAEVEEALAPKWRSRRSQPKQEQSKPGQAAHAPVEAVAVAPLESVMLALGDDRELEMVWRPRQAETPKAEVVADENPRDARGRGRRGRDRRERPAPVADFADVESAPVSVVEEESEQDLVWMRALESAFPGDEFPRPLWRERTAGAQAKSEAQAAERAADDANAEEGDSGRDPSGRRRRRRRGGKDRGDRVATEAVEVSFADGEDDEDEEAEPVAKPEPRKIKTTLNARPEPPVVAVRPILPIPDAAPQIVTRNGMPTLVRQGRVYPPLFFSGSASDERRAQTFLEEVRMAAESGVHLHAVRVELIVDNRSTEDAIASATRILKRIVDVDRDAQVLFRLAFRAPHNWQDKYSKARYRLRDGSTAEPSICDDQFWGDARECLEQFTREVRAHQLRDHVLGVHLDRQEWFIGDEQGYDESEAAKLQFRSWARTRYVNDEVMLRASWFDGTARFDTIVPPQYQPEGAEGERFVRSSRKQRRYVDYHLFLSDVTVQRIGELAYAAKKASEGYFLVGVSYGYTFEWSHPGNGHLSLGKLLRTPEIDFVCGPPSYKNREPGGTGAFPGPIDSFALNGKLFLSEEDFKTTLGTGGEIDDSNPAIKTPQALESVHWRGAGSAVAHAGGALWEDSASAGWLKTPSVWDRAAKVIEAMVRRMSAPTNDPDVTVFVDERALAYLVDPNAFTLLVQNVREAVLRAGVSAGFYLLSDLAHREKFPESKLYLFLNAWDIRPDLRAAIKTRLQQDGKVLFWLYSAGLFDAGRDSLERAREVTGIALKPQPYHSKSGTTILNRRHPLCEAFPDRSVIGASKLEPSYFAIPEDATVLGEYSQTGLPSFVVRDFVENGEEGGRWTSVFLGEPQVNPALIRALATMAGAHVWNFNEDVVHVRPPFLTVHCKTPGPRTVALPDKVCAYHVQTNSWVAVDNTHLKFTAVEGSTHTFIVGTQEEVQNLIHTDPAEWLKMDVLPPREANMREDVSSFDVPIMRLGEWIEGGESDDVADEWFLRPIVVEMDEISDPQDAPGGDTDDRSSRGRPRRRRRGGRGEGSGSDASRREFGATPIAVEDLSMNIMFRKRE